MELYLTVFIALTIIPIISGVCSRLASLPVDLVSVGISIVVIIVTKTSAFIAAGDLIANPAWPYIYIYIILIAVILTFMTVGFYYFYRTSYVTAADGTEVPSIHTVITYFFSTVTSTTFLFLGYAIALNARTVFSLELKGRGELARIGTEIAASLGGPYILLVLVAFPALVTIFQRQLGRS